MLLQQITSPTFAFRIKCDTVRMECESHQQAPTEVVLFGYVSKVLNGERSITDRTAAITFQDCEREKRLNTADYVNNIGYLGSILCGPGPTDTVLVMLLFHEEDLAGRLNWVHGIRDADAVWITIDAVLDPNSTVEKQMSGKVVAWRASIERKLQGNADS